jgi:peptide deformylase
MLKATKKLGVLLLTVACFSVKCAIVKYPDPILFVISAKIDVNNEKERKEALSILAELSKILNADPSCIGLSAPQIGRPRRLIVVNIKGENSREFKMINPKIIEKSEGDTVEIPDACMSLPEAFALTRRYRRVKVKYIDENLQEQMIEAEGLLACCLQHEIDHLDGKMFIDLLKPTQRNEILCIYNDAKLSKEEKGTRFLESFLNNISEDWAKEYLRKMATILFKNELNPSGLIILNEILRLGNAGFTISPESKTLTELEYGQILQAITRLTRDNLKEILRPLFMAKQKATDEGKKIECKK